MKKLLIAILFCFISTMLFAESYQLPTSQGDKELYIPDNPIKLRQAYIDMASLYLEERFDHEKSLDHVDSLLSLTDEYKTYFTTLEETTQGLIRELSEDTPDLFRFYLTGHYRYNFLSPGLNLGIGFQIQIFESLMIGVFYEVPTSVGIRVSGRLY